MSDFIENSDQAETGQSQQNILDIEIVNKEDDYDDQDEEEEEDDIESEIVEASIQLGFVQKDINPLFKEADWTTWDGGKVGGKPVSTLFLILILVLIMMSFKDLVRS